MKIKSKVQSRSWSFGIARFILAAVFIYAAISKIGSSQEFADSLAAYQILPPSVINVMALGVPLFEFVCGVLVLTGFLLRLGAFGILSMLTIFMGALAIALFRGLSIDCGCFGAHSWLDSNPWISLIRDGILLALAALVYRRSLGEVRREETQSSPESLQATDLA